MECLDEETILAFCGGPASSRTPGAPGAPLLDAAARAAAELHISTCDECRQLVSAVARSSFVDPSELGAAGPNSRPLRASASHAAALADPEDREDLPLGPLLRGRVDAMGPTTPIGAAGLEGSGRPSVSPVQPGEILAGKFLVERVLGAGGMGVVVAARHTQLEQRVALKFLLPVACEVPGAVTRFLREGKAAARITSEHVARVMDTGVLDGGAPYLVMEYLEGSDLGAVVQRRGRVSADEAIEYVLQACEAIVEAHDLGIVHRDLKPANLFLSKRADGSDLVKVLDFGISKVEGSGSRSQLTSASVLMGSPRYMSPEQMLSAKDVDARTDVWALGVILYELVTGKPVWHADTMQGLCALIASSPAPSLLLAAPDAPKALADVVAHCLAKSREERVASVADLALALEPIAPAVARTSIDRILRVARKDRGVSTGPKLAPAAAEVVSAASGIARAPGSPDATTNGAVRPKGPGVGLLLAVVVAALLVVGIVVNAAVARQAPPVTPSSTGPATSAGAASGTALPSTSAAPASSTDESAHVPVAAMSASVARRALRAPQSSSHAQSAAQATPPATAAEAPAAPKASAPAPSGNRALTDRK
jgi:serine/threonine-protein kinase